MSVTKNETELEKLRRSVAELGAQLASLADQVNRLCEEDNSKDCSKDSSPDTSDVDKPQLRFTKGGEPLPEGPFPIPEGANDIKIVWNRGCIAAAWWTRNCRSFASIPVPPEANDLHLEGLHPTPARTLRKSSSGDDVRRLQEDLTWLGYESVELTGVFDEATEVAVCSIQDATGLSPNGIVDSTTRGAIEILVKETTIAEMTSLTAEDIQSLTLTVAALLAQDRPPEGPRHKKWREKLRQAYARRLREEGFTEDEIKKIILDSLMGLWGILKNLWRLYKALRAFKKAKKDAGEEPPWEK